MDLRIYMTLTLYGINIPSLLEFEDPGGEREQF